MKKPAPSAPIKSKIAKQQRNEKVQKHIEQLEETLSPPVPLEDTDLADTDFAEKAERMIAINAEIKALEAEKDELKDELKPLLEATGERSIDGGAWTATFAKGRGASKLDPTKLVSAGVDPKVIDKCTIPGKEYTYVLVTMKKVKEGGDSDD